MSKEIPIENLEAEVILNVKFSDGHVMSYSFDRNGSVFTEALKEFIAYLETML